MSNVTDHQDMGGAESGLPRALRPYLAASTILAVLLLLHFGWIEWKTATSMPTIDFFTSWSVSHALSRMPIANIYSPESKREMWSLAVTEAQSPNASDLQRQAAKRMAEYGGGTDATGTPLLYTLIGLLSSGNFATDQRRFVFVCTMCLFASMIVFQKLLRFSLVQIALITLFTAGYFAPVLTDMYAGNVNEIQLFAVALFVYFTVRARPLLAGLAIGTITMIKPTTLAVLPLIVIAGVADREYRQLLRTLLGGSIAAAASLLASVAYFGDPTIWLKFAHGLNTTLDGVRYSLQDGNYSLPALIFGATSGSSTIIPVVLLAVFSCVFFATRRKPASGRSNAPSEEMDRLWRTHAAFAVAGGGCAITLLSSPLVWAHYYLLLLPLLLYLIGPAIANTSMNINKETWSFPMIQGDLSLLLSFVPLLMFSFLTERIVSKDARSTCILFVSATILTFALASYRVRRERRVLQILSSY